MRPATAAAMGTAGLLGRLAMAMPPLGEGLVPPLEQSPDRDDAIRAMLPLVPEMGWSVRALRQAAGPDADLLFPGGPVEMVEAHSDLADREMMADANGVGAGMTRRVRALLLSRLRRAEPDRAAVRRGLALLSLPGNRPAGARALARTSDAVWLAAGDTSTGFSRHSRRATLGGVYAATLLFWLRDDAAPDDVEAFLDRRLDGVRRLGTLRRRLSGGG